MCYLGHPMGEKPSTHIHKPESPMAHPLFAWKEEDIYIVIDKLGIGQHYDKTAGLGLGDNARGSIITLGLREMNAFGRHYGAKRKTFYGLAGVGDLVATCTSKHSRNRFVGEKLAEGKSLEEIKEEMHGMVAEGIKTVKAVYEFAQKHNIDMPITHQAYKVIYESKNIKKAVKDLVRLI